MTAIGLQPAEPAIAPLAELASPMESVEASTPQANMPLVKPKTEPRYNDDAVTDQAVVKPPHATIEPDHVDDWLSRVPKGVYGLGAAAGCSFLVMAWTGRNSGSIWLALLVLLNAVAILSLASRSELVRRLAVGLGLITMVAVCLNFVGLFAIHQRTQSSQAAYRQAVSDASSINPAASRSDPAVLAAQAQLDMVRRQAGDATHQQLGQILVIVICSAQVSYLTRRWVRRAFS